MSNASQRRAVIITGTDTNVGKTVVSAWLTLHWPADYWKPVQSGSPPMTTQTDTDRIGVLSGANRHPEAYRLTQLQSPHKAAAFDGVKIELSRFQLPVADRLIVEMAGGLLAPLNDRDSVAELAKHLALPVVIVARSGLGTINHTRLTIEAVRARGIPLLGVIMVGPMNQSNREAITHYGQATVLAELPWIEPPSRAALQGIALPAALRAALDGAVVDA